MSFKVEINLQLKQQKVVLAWWVEDGKGKGWKESREEEMFKPPECYTQQYRLYCVSTVSKVE